MHLLDKISSAITYTLFEQLQAEVSAHNGNVRECAAFVLGQVRRMPDYLWPPFYLLAVCLTLISLGTGGCFHTIAPEKRMLLLRRWQRQGKFYLPVPV